MEFSRVGKLLGERRGLPSCLEGCTDGLCGIVNELNEDRADGQSSRGWGDIGYEMPQSRSVEHDGLVHLEFHNGAGGLGDPGSMIQR